MVLVGQFSMPEGGADKIFGEAGDQLQGADWETADSFPGEVNIVEYYPESWSVIYRPIDYRLGLRISNNMEAAARNKHVGYSQGPNRYTFGEALAQAGGDAADITIDCSADCSSGLSALLRNEGVEVPAGMVTANEDRCLMQTRLFIKIDDPEYLEHTELMRKGDILWRPGHTGIVILKPPYAPLPAVRQWKATGTAYRRIGAGITYPSIGTMQRGETGLSFDYDRVGKWIILTNANDMLAFVSDKNLEIIDQVIIREYVIVTGIGVWLRNGPSTMYKTAGLVRKGNRLLYSGRTLYDERGVAWYEVDRDGRLSWISSKYSYVEQEVEE